MLVALGFASCGGAAAPEARTATGAKSAAPNVPARPRELQLVSSRRLPAPVQLPAMATAGGATILAGGLNAADASVTDVVHAAPGTPVRVGALPQAVHDAGAAALGGSVYLFGGGTAAGPVNSVVRIDGRGRASTAGRLPLAISDATAVALGGSVYVIGGFTVQTPQRSVLRFTPGSPVRQVAQLPHPVRYAAAAAIGGRLLVAGGTDGTTARREVLEIDPARGRVRVIGRLPGTLAHAAGVAFGGTFFVLGGRGDGTAGQRDAILAVDPHSGAARRPAAGGAVGPVRRGVGPARARGRRPGPERHRARPAAGAAGPLMRSPAVIAVGAVAVLAVFAGCGGGGTPWLSARPTGPRRNGIPASPAPARCRPGASPP